MPFKRFLIEFLLAFPDWIVRTVVTRRRVHLEFPALQLSFREELGDLFFPGRRIVGMRNLGIDFLPLWFVFTRLAGTCEIGLEGTVKAFQVC